MINQLESPCSDQKVIRRGFTLVEFAIVLTLFGLLVAGVVRGTELIGSAKVRKMIDQRTAIQTALLAFSNRYQSTAGDLTANQANFIAAAGSPNRAIPSGEGGNGLINIALESVLVFQNLAATHFLSCANCMTVTLGGPANNENSPTNPFSNALQFGTVAPGANGLFWLEPNALLPARNALTTGSMVASPLLREIDLKADDGQPHTGLFRQSSTGGAGLNGDCSPTNAWNTVTQANCAGAWLFQPLAPRFGFS
jgi:prepilin-type N-terminal cleavage/methylation domain-containing protein